jgi:hypothetical protein
LLVKILSVWLSYFYRFRLGIAVGYVLLAPIEEGVDVLSVKPVVEIFPVSFVPVLVPKVVDNIISCYAAR